jgi:hypothetical protein
MMVVGTGPACGWMFLPPLIPNTFQKVSLDLVGTHTIPQDLEDDLVYFCFLRNK